MTQEQTQERTLPIIYRIHRTLATASWWQTFRFCNTTRVVVSSPLMVAMLDLTLNTAVMILSVVRAVAHAYDL